MAPVTKGTIARTVSATGTVNPVLTVIVGSYVSGVIREVSCDYNTQVVPGQICARIDPRPYQTTVDQNKANLSVAEAQLEKDHADLSYDKLTYERNARLAETNAVSKDAADFAKKALDGTHTVGQTVITRINDANACELGILQHLCNIACRFEMLGFHNS